MPTPEALLMAALTMDVYSRGYNPALSDGVDNTPDDERGEDGLGENSNGTQTLGPVKVFWSIEDAKIYDGAEDIGFHAIAYQLTEWGERALGFQRGGVVRARCGIARCAVGAGAGRHDRRWGRVGAGGAAETAGLLFEDPTWAELGIAIMEYNG